MPRQAMRKRLNAAGLLALSRRCLERIEDETPGRTYRLVDCSNSPYSPNPAIGMDFAHWLSQ